jgi:hypothetical protein
MTIPRGSPAANLRHEVAGRVTDPQVDKTVESVGRTGNLHFPSQAPPPGRVPHVCTGVAGALRGLKTMGEALPLFQTAHPARLPLRPQALLFWSRLWTLMLTKVNMIRLFR